MDMLYPDFVVIELCKNRSRAIMMDEEKLKDQLKNLKVLDLVKQVSKTTVYSFKNVK